MRYPLKPSTGWLERALVALAIVILSVVTRGVDPTTVIVGSVVSLILLSAFDWLQRKLSYVELRQDNFIYSYYVIGPRTREVIDYAAIVGVHMGPRGVEVRYHPKLNTGKYASYTWPLRFEPKQPERLVADLNSRTPAASPTGTSSSE